MFGVHFKDFGGAFEISIMHPHIAFHLRIHGIFISNQPGHAFRQIFGWFHISNTRIQHIFYFGNGGVGSRIIARRSRIIFGVLAIGRFDRAEINIAA